MAYKDTYRAYVRNWDGTETEWTGLRKTQAIWRYHWIDRNQRKLFPRLDQFGWQREWQA